MFCWPCISIYEVVTKIFRTDALPTSTQLRATWHTNSLHMVVLSFTGASRYHYCCIDGGTSPECFGYHLVEGHSIVWSAAICELHSRLEILNSPPFVRISKLVCLLISWNRAALYEAAPLFDLQNWVNATSKIKYFSTTKLNSRSNIYPLWCPLSYMHCTSCKRQIAKSGPTLKVCYWHRVISG
jgi:hypothetical protein